MAHTIAYNFIVSCAMPSWSSMIRTFVGLYSFTVGTNNQVDMDIGEIFDIPIAERSTVAVVVSDG